MPYRLTDLVDIDSLNELLEHIYEKSPIGIEYFDKQGLLLHVNNTCRKIYGVPDDEVFQGLLLFRDFYMDEGLKDILCQGGTVRYERVVDFDRVRELKLYQTVKTGKMYIDAHITPIVRSDTSKISGYLVQVQDITERKDAESRSNYFSFHDVMTGLFNRTYFEQTMQRLESEPQWPMGIIICDIDGLKLVNDTLGHEAGDTLLKEAASVIRQCFAEDELVARIGGDEFAILLPGTHKDIVEAAHRNIKNALFQYNCHNPVIPLSISAGCAISKDDSADMKELFKEADNNMYSEKLNCRHSAYNTIVQTLMQALEERDFITSGHVNRLQDMVIKLSRNLSLSGNRLTGLRLLAQFHDIGKVGVPDRILFKPGPLTNEEYTEIKRHCEVGHRIAQTATHLASIADWILKHHERWDGTGYPDGLKGENIPLECRILAIADAYDAMTSERPYRRAMPSEKALAELRRCAGTQFDPHLVAVFTQELENWVL